MLDPRERDDRSANVTSDGVSEMMAGCGIGGEGTHVRANGAEESDRRIIRDTRRPRRDVEIRD